MMNRLRAWALASAAVVTAVGGARAGAPETPKRDPGVYLATKNADGQEAVTRLRGGQAADTQTHGIAKSMLTYGLSKPTMSIELPGTTADIHTSGAPVFYLYLNAPQKNPDASALFAQMMSGDMMPLSGRAGDFTLVLTTVTENGRYIDLGKIGSNKPKGRVDIVLERLEQSVYRVKPKKPLAPGEYAFVFAGGMGGTAWDFAVDK